MTKKINNNEIETLEGVYEETMNSNNQYNEQPKRAKRNFLKPLIIQRMLTVKLNMMNNLKNLNEVF